MDSNANVSWNTYIAIFVKLKISHSNTPSHLKLERLPHMFGPYQNIISASNSQDFTPMDLLKDWLKA